jgi:AcrR family transcriptional regulator
VTFDTPPEAARRRPLSDVENRILDAVLDCSRRWGFDRMTVDDIVEHSGVSRATVYRTFPGGKDVLFEALRVRELDLFFSALASELADADDLTEVLVRSLVTATSHLRADDHLALMLASEPGQTLTDLTVAGLPRIINMASETLAPWVAPHLAADEARLLIDVLVRLTISYFLAPSEHLDLAEPDQARAFLTPVLSALGQRPGDPVRTDTTTTDQIPTDRSMR